MTGNDSGTKISLNKIDLDTNFGDLLDPDERKYLLEHGKVYEATNGTILCHDGEMGDTVFIILKGEVQIKKESDGETKILGHLSTGELVGEISALLSMPRIATVEVTKPSIILEIKFDAFATLIEQVPNLKNMVYKKLYERTIETTIQSQTKS